MGEYHRVVPTRFAFLQQLGIFIGKHLPLLAVA
jgi:hypothetical protein